MLRNLESEGSKDKKDMFLRVLDDNCRMRCVSGNIFEAMGGLKRDLSLVPEKNPGKSGRGQGLRAGL